MEIQFTPEEMEAVLKKEIQTMRDINKTISHELDIQKARADHYRSLCEWAYKVSRETLMLEPGFRGFKHARDKALSEINYKLGGAIR